MGHTAKTERLVNQAAGLLRRSDGGEPEQIVPILSLQAPLHRDAGRLREAVAVYDDAIRSSLRRGERHPKLAMLFSDLGTLQTAMQKHNDAERNYEQALRLLQAAHSGSHPSVVMTLFRLAELKVARRQYDAAVSLIEQANSGIEVLYGREHPGLVATSPTYALALRKTGRKSEAKLVEERTARIRRTIPAELSKKHTVDFYGASLSHKISNHVLGVGSDSVSAGGDDAVAHTFCRRPSAPRQNLCIPQPVQ